MDKVLELAKKIQALAQQGVGGEKENAKIMLDKYLKANGLTYKDLEDNEDEFYQYFTYTGISEKRMLKQVIYAVCGNTDYYQPDRKNKDKQLIILINNLKAAEIQISFEHYKKAYEEQESLFYSAFVHKHNISPKEGGKLESELTDEERKRLSKIQRMMRVVEENPVKKQLTQTT